jgi:uncharacterized membrane protein YedE/YeeE
LLHRLLFPLFANSKKVNTKPRSASNLGWFGPYDGNIIGGAILGAGMALTGACPGTVFVQVGAGVPSGIPVLLGCALGGITYVKIAKYLQTKAAREQKSDESKLTLSQKLDTDPNLTLLTFEAVIVGMVSITTKLQPGNTRILDPVLSGILIGSSQLASLWLAGMPLGISGSYEELGRWVWYLVDRIQGIGAKKDQDSENSAPASAPPKPAYKHIIFGFGIIAGTILLRNLRPEFAIRDESTMPLLRSLAGGFALVFGSRLGGGCTSGHGLSGAALLSISSFITVAAMFAGGIGFATAFLK